jgi:hypothetical protein
MFNIVLLYRTRLTYLVLSMDLSTFFLSAPMTSSISLTLDSLKPGVYSMAFSLFSTPSARICFNALWYSYGKTWKRNGSVRYWL